MANRAEDTFVTVAIVGLLAYLGYLMFKGVSAITGVGGPSLYDNIATANANANAGGTMIYTDAQGNPTDFWGLVQSINNSPMIGG